MTKATNAVLTKQNDWMTFTIRRKSNKATVERLENGHTEIWESISITMADEMYTNALASGYKVAF